MSGKSILSKFVYFVTLGHLRNAIPKVAVLQLKGVIGDTARLRGKGLTLEEVRPQIEKAFETKGIHAVAVSINSPGGSPVQSALIHDEICRLADEKNIPVAAFVEDVCASGGYWIACAADEIYAHSTSIVGSIGVVMSGFGLDKLIERIGVTRRIYTQGENKVILDPFQPEKQEDVNRILTIQRDIHTAFKELVKKSRGKRLNADEDELFSGAFWSGVAARDLGLVDGIGNIETIMKNKFGKKVKLIRIEPKKGFISSLLKGKAFAPKAHWSQEMLSTIEERMHWSRFGL